MSFQHFRLGDLSLHNSVQHHIQHHQQLNPQSPLSGQSQFPVQIENPVIFSVSLKKQPQQASKLPYGSGDAEEGYDLVFADMQEFNKWREAEEERTMCEFVKGDTHGSKAVPPRFKDHTKLVCARHSRSGRKKYIKKHPERTRKVPSRKLEAGCPASISYKTYFDTEEIRACYFEAHSHEIGPANLPFTRRGRKENARVEKDKPCSPTTVQSHQDTAAANSSTSTQPPASIPSTSDSPSLSISAPSTTIAISGADRIGAPSTTNFSPPTASEASPAQTYSTTTSTSVLSSLSTSQSSFPVQTGQTYLFAPSTSQITYTQPPQPPAPPAALPPDRWENMASLFHSIREHARSYEYPNASVAALETILFRLYCETPINMSALPAPNMGMMIQNNIAHQRASINISTTSQTGVNINNGTANDLTSGSSTTDKNV